MILNMPSYKVGLNLKVCSLGDLAGSHMDEKWRLIIAGFTAMKQCVSVYVIHKSSSAVIRT